MSRSFDVRGGFAPAFRCPGRMAISGLFLFGSLAGMATHAQTPNHVKQEGDRVWIEDVPRAQRKGIDWLGQAITLVLPPSDPGADYVTVMGDSGLAFTMQASEQAALIDASGQMVGHAPEDLGKVEARRDVGWWPITSETAPAYVAFLSEVSGRPFRVLGSGVHPGADGLEKRYETMHPEIVQAIAGGQAVAVNAQDWSVAIGYDGGQPPLWSFCPGGGPNAEAMRLENLPWIALLPGVRSEVPDRPAADSKALGHAVALARGEVPLPNGYQTGQPAFVLWINELKQTQPLEPGRGHANVVGRLRVRRRAAVDYLEAMAKRYEGPANEHLLKAAGHYRDVLGFIGQAKIRHGAMNTVEGRQQLAQLAERMAASDLLAAEELEQAAASMH